MLSNLLDSIAVKVKGVMKPLVRPPVKLTVPADSAFFRRFAARYFFWAAGAARRDDPVFYFEFASEEALVRFFREAPGGRESIRQSFPIDSAPGAPCFTTDIVPPLRMRFSINTGTMCLGFRYVVRNPCGFIVNM